MSIKGGRISATTIIAAACMMGVGFPVSHGGASYIPQAPETPPKPPEYYNAQSERALSKAQAKRARRAAKRRKGNGPQ